MEIELEKVDQVLNKYEYEEGMLIQILQDVQSELNWLPREAMERVCEGLKIPLSRAYNIGTFYTLFSLEPRGRHLVNVCMGTACHVRGGAKVLDKVEQSLGINAGKTSTDMRYSLEKVNCLGCCALGPVMVVNGEAHGKLAVSEIPKILDGYE